MTTDAELARVGEQREGTVTLDVLRYLGLDPSNIEARALVLLCSRYRLDPLLGHVAVIRTKHGQKVYVTRDGLLAVAHRSGMLNGIVVEEERRASDDGGWTAIVSVYVKGCEYPFTYGAQCRDTEDPARAGNGPEMALARAERRALRRAFSVPAMGDASDDLDAIAEDVIELPEQQSTPEPPRPQLGRSEQSLAHVEVAAWSSEDRDAFLARHELEDFGAVWPDEAVTDALTRRSA